MTDHDQAYADGGWLEPGKTVMVALDPDECIIRPVAGGRWRCVRDHQCRPNRWWEASSRDWTRMTYDEQRAFLGLPDVRRDVIRDAVLSSFRAVAAGFGEAAEAFRRFGDPSPEIVDQTTEIIIESLDEVTKWVRGD